MELIKAFPAELDQRTIYKMMTSPDVQKMSDADGSILEVAAWISYTDTDSRTGEIKELLVNRKWYYSIFAGIKALYVTASHNMANRIIELAERYEYDLPWLEKEAEVLEAKVKAHLERMGFVW